MQRGFFVPVIRVCLFFEPAIIDGNEANLVLGVPMMRSDVFVSGLARWRVWTCRSLMDSRKGECALRGSLTRQDISYSRNSGLRPQRPQPRTKRARPNCMRGIVRYPCQ